MALETSSWKYGSKMRLSLKRRLRHTSPHIFSFLIIGLIVLSGLFPFVHASAVKSATFTYGAQAGGMFTGSSSGGDWWNLDDYDGVKYFSLAYIGSDAKVHISIFTCDSNNVATTSVANLSSTHTGSYATGVVYLEAFNTTHMYAMAAIGGTGANSPIWLLDVVSFLGATPAIVVEDTISTGGLQATTPMSMARVNSTTREWISTIALHTISIAKVEDDCSLTLYTELGTADPNHMMYANNIILAYHDTVSDKIYFFINSHGGDRVAYGWYDVGGATWQAAYSTSEFIEYPITYEAFAPVRVSDFVYTAVSNYRRFTFDLYAYQYYTGWGGWESGRKTWTFSFTEGASPAGAAYSVVSDYGIVSTNFYCGGWTVNSTSSISFWSGGGSHVLIYSHDHSVYINGVTYTPFSAIDSPDVILPSGEVQITLADNTFTFYYNGNAAITTTTTYSPTTSTSTTSTSYTPPPTTTTTGVWDPSVIAAFMVPLALVCLPAMVLGYMIGMAGFLFGGILGVGMGVGAGWIPAWLLILVGLIAAGFFFSKIQFGSDKGRE